MGNSSIYIAKDSVSVNLETKNSNELYIGTIYFNWNCTICRSNKKVVGRGIKEKKTVIIIAVFFVWRKLILKTEVNQKIK